MSRTKIGRNDPCPCGSGKKFKRCCALREGHPTNPGNPTRYSTEDRAEALARLHDFVNQDRWDDTIKTGMQVAWGIHSYNELLVSTVMNAEPGTGPHLCAAATQDWLHFSYEIPLDGRRLVDVLLEEQPDIPPRQGSYLKQMRNTWMIPYEVEQAMPGQSLVLRDALADRRVTVRERKASASLTRWDLVLARVVEPGASGQPQIDTLIPLARMHDRQWLNDLRQRWARCLKGSLADKESFLRSLVPEACQRILTALKQGPNVDVRMPDGDMAIDCTLRFDGVDPEAATAALDSAKDMVRSGQEPRWSWAKRGQSSQRGPVDIELQDTRLAVRTATQKSAHEVRNRLRRLLGKDLREGPAEYQDLGRATAEASLRYDDSQAEHAFLPEEADDFLLEKYEDHYSGWIDEPVPGLQDMTPRQAAKSRKLRPQLVEMLKDLEVMYRRALQHGQIGYDPYWMWDELGLSDDPAAPNQGPLPPPLGHEALARQIPELNAAVRRIVESLPPLETPRDGAVSREQLAHCLPFKSFLEERAKAFHASGFSSKDAVGNANLLGCHLDYICNYERHKRKTFWVEESLGTMLLETQLDISGSALRMPFACVALVFSDRPTLQLAERVLAREDCTHRGRLLRVITVYMLEAEEDGQRGLRLAFTFDDGSPQWPYLLVRELLIDEDANLEQLLESHHADIDPAERDPIFTRPPFKKLVQLALNAILYATCAGPPRYDAPLIGQSAPPRSPKTSSLTSESVYHLPGHIDIMDARRITRLRRTQAGRKYVHRFMVRGHWRRPAENWHDQSPRWIKPHWRGPKIAALLERTYRLKAPPSDQGSGQK